MRWCSPGCRKARPTRSRKRSPAISPWSPCRWATCPGVSRASRAVSCVPTNGRLPSPQRWNACCAGTAVSQRATPCWTWTRGDSRRRSSPSTGRCWHVATATRGSWRRRVPSFERVLVLDGQTTQGLACVRSLGRAGHTVFVASPLRRPLAAWSRYCRAHFRLGDETIAAFAALRAWAQTQGVRVVLPQRERSCLLCDAERAQWEAAGIVVGCGPQDMLLHAFDKARTLELAAACGVRTPPTRFPQTLAEARADAEAIGYPCILKPRFSDFWDGGRFQADHGARYVPDPAGLEAGVAACRRREAWALLRGDRVAPTTAYETGVTLRWAWGDVKRLLYVVAGAPPGCPEPYPSVLQGLREVLGPQPVGTRSETWRSDDRWPGVGEWMQGIGGLGGLFRATFARRLRRAPPPRLSDIPKRATPTPGSQTPEVMRP